MGARAEAVDRADPGHDEASNRLDENLAAADLSLTADGPARHRTRRSGGIAVQGDRYPPHLAKMVER